MSDTNNSTSVVLDLTSLGVDGSWIGPPLLLPLDSAETADLATIIGESLAEHLPQLTFRLLLLHLSKLLRSMPEQRWLSSGELLLLLGSSLSSAEKLADEK